MSHRPDLPTQTHLAWARSAHSGLAELGPAFATTTLPSPLPAPHWVGCNDALREALGLPADLWLQPDALAVLTGNQVLADVSPYASVYSGHQFGHWAGQLGDGRALNIATLDTPMGVQILQLKGAGPTP